jgi:hypothetical protein
VNVPFTPRLPNLVWANENSGGIESPAELVPVEPEAEWECHASVIPLKRALIEEHRIESIRLEERHVEGCVDLICKGANCRHGVSI